MVPNLPCSARAQQRAILHVDLDCFYCQVEHVRLGIPVAQPVGVQQWHSLIAVNYAARAAGVQRHMTVPEARALCPDLRLVHVATYRRGDTHYAYHADPKPYSHKVSLDPYRAASAAVLRILTMVGPNVQRASVDEAFLDVTDQVDAIVEDLRRAGRLPLVDTPVDSSSGAAGVTGPWTGVASDPVEADGEPEVRWSTPIDWSVVTSFPGPNGPAPLDSPLVNAFATQSVLSNDRTFGWPNLQLWVAANIANYLRARILTDLHFTCSAGVGHNLTLAKLGSAMHKPNQQTVIRLGETLTYMKDLSLPKIRSLGGKIGTDVCQKFEVTTAGDLWTYTLPQLREHFDAERALYLFNICRGIDDSQDSLLEWFKVLCAELHHRLQDEWNSSQRWPKSILFHYKTEHANARSKSGVLPAYSPEFLASPEPFFRLRNNPNHHYARHNHHRRNLSLNQNQNQKRSASKPPIHD
ncbi:N-acetyltransferase eso1 [Dimargaris cristalligena]|nr:N-acetyltransferase eso1 [Dimargaris cristalligena]